MPSMPWSSAVERASAGETCSDLSSSTHRREPHGLSTTSAKVAATKSVFPGPLQLKTMPLSVSQLRYWESVRPSQSLMSGEKPRLWRAPATLAHLEAALAPLLVRWQSEISLDEIRLRAHLLQQTINSHRKEMTMIHHNHRQVAAIHLNLQALNRIHDHQETHRR